MGENSFINKNEIGAIKFEIMGINLKPLKMTFIYIKLGLMQ